MMDGAAWSGRTAHRSNSNASRATTAAAPSTTTNSTATSTTQQHTTTHNNTQQHTTKQVAYVALAVKQGSQVSDMRHHAYKGRLRGAQLVYFRANDAGACGYFEDSR